MISNWYSRDYLGREFDKFLKSEMKLSDFTQLQVVLQQVLVQLRLLDNFTKSGYPSRDGKIHTKTKEAKEMFI